MSKGLIQGLISALVITLASLFVAYPSFKLALFGDDWQQIWNFLHMLGKPTLVNYFTYFISGYGAFEMTSGILYGIFGSDYKMYYIFSYICKLIAAFSIWPLIFYLTRSKLAAFYASLFLSVTTIGLESTNWVINSPAYLAIANLSIFLYFFIKSREDLKPKLFNIPVPKSFFGAILFFYLAHVFAPVRMTGLLPFTILLEGFLFLKFSNLKLSLFRLVSIIIIFMVISTTGAAGGRGANSILGEASQQLNTGFAKILTMSQTRTDFLFYPIMTVGRLVIPNTIVLQKPTAYFSIVLFLAVLLFNIPKGKKIAPFAIAGIVLWTIASSIIYRLNRITLSIPDVISLLMGGYALITGFILMIFSENKKISIIFFLGVFWCIFSFIFPWIRSPETLDATDHRYLIPAAVGITILLSAFIGAGEKLKKRVNLLALVIPFLLINMITTRAFFTDVVENSHGSEAMSKIWADFPEIPEIGKSEKPLLFYFESVPEKHRLKHHVLTFGFPFRMAMLHNIDGWNKMPYSTNEWSDLVSAVTDGRVFELNGLAKEPVPLENIYSFFLTSDNHLINTTAETRKKLRELQTSSQ